MKAPAPAEAPDPGDGVRGAAAGDLDRRSELGVEVLDAGGVDEGHRTRLQPELVHEVVGRVRDHVHQRVADGNDVIRASAMSVES